MMLSEQESTVGFGISKSKSHRNGIGAVGRLDWISREPKYFMIKNIPWVCIGLNLLKKFIDFFYLDGFWRVDGFFFF